MLFVLQRRILFNTSGHPGTPADYQLYSTKEIQIVTEDKIKLLAWLHLGDKKLGIKSYSANGTRWILSYIK